jgi:hypothetical protein
MGCGFFFLRSFRPVNITVRQNMRIPKKKEGQKQK